MQLLYLVLGLLGLVFGAELAVKGALGVARRLGWPSWLTGLVLLATGTSLPELFVSGVAAPRFPSLALGNIFGSNAFNSGLVLGLLLLLSESRTVRLRGLDRGASIVLGAAAIASLWLFGGSDVPFLAGPLLLGSYGVLVLSSLRTGRGQVRVQEEDLLPVGERPARRNPLIWHGTVMLAGFAILALASEAFLRGALHLAGLLGWSEGFAGYLIAAAGTSAPELFTSLRAVRYGHAAAVVGNVFGSNAFNLLVVGGAVGLLAQGPVDPGYVRPQLWVNLGACLVVALPALIPARRALVAPTARLLGGLLVAGYLICAFVVSGS